MLLALSLTASPMPAPAAEDAGDGTSFTLVLDGADIDGAFLRFQLRGVRWGITLL